MVFFEVPLRRWPSYPLAGLAHPDALFRHADGVKYGHMHIGFGKDPEGTAHRTGSVSMVPRGTSSRSCPKITCPSNTSPTSCSTRSRTPGVSSCSVR